MKRLLIIIVLLLFVPSVKAADVYIAQTSAGGNTGANCANAKALTAIAALNPGDTGHLCGTITSAITTIPSGTSGNPVTIKFETGAKMSAPSWGSGDTILLQNGQSWITIDGGTTCGWVNQAEVACNGTIEATDNGTMLGHQDAGGGIFGRYVNNVTVKNLAISNLFVRTAVGGGTGEQGDGIHLDGSNNLIENDSCHDSYQCFTLGRQGSATAGSGEMRNDFAFNANWDFASGDNGDFSVFNGLLIHDNEGYDWSNWDGDGHHNGVIVYVTGDNSAVTGLQIYNNYFHGNTGAHMTSPVFLDGEGNGSAGGYSGALVFNNIFDLTGQPNTPSEGLSYYIAKGGTSNVGDYNNTRIFDPAQKSTCLNNDGNVMTWKNDIFVNCNTMYFSPHGSIASADFNDANGVVAFGPDASGINTTLSLWQGATGQDTHSIASAPALTGYVPMMGSPVRGAAANLTNLVIAALNLDPAGTTRPGGSTLWDMGAYQFVGSPGPYTITFQSTNPASAVSVTATSDNNGKTAGTTSTTFVYSSGTSPALVAPTTAGGNSFSSWTGCTSPSSNTCTMTSLSASSAITANYAVTPPVVLTVNSTNPASGVSVVCTSVTASTSFTHNYLLGAAVTCTAPSTAGVNTFLNWGNCPSVSGPACIFSSLGANTTITANYATPPPATGCQVSSSSFSNMSIPTQAGTFTVTYNDTPSQLNMDGVLGFGNGAATAYSNLAVITRFNPSGTIDAWNQAVTNYAAVNSFSYLANVPYNFRLVINTTAGTYDAYVTAPGGMETQIASGYTFRTGPETLNNWAVSGEVASHTGCAVGVVNPNPSPQRPIIITKFAIGDTFKITPTSVTWNASVLQ